MESRSIGDDLRLRPSESASVPAIVAPKHGVSRRFGLMLRRRWRWVGGMILAGLIVGTVICRTATPMYTASAQLMVQASGGTTAGQSAVGRNDSERQAFVRTQQQLLTSGAVLAMAVSSPGIRELSLLKGETELDADAMGAMKRLLRIDSDNGNDFITISCDADDGREATRLVAAVVDSFVRFETGLQVAGTGGSASELHRELVAARSEWKAKWSALQHFSAQNGLSTGDEQIDSDNAALHAMGLRLAAAHVDTASAKAAYDEMQRDLQDESGIADRLAKLTDDSAYADGDPNAIEQQISVIKRELSSYVGHFMANYPAVINGNRKLADLQLARAAVIRHRWQAATRCEQDLQASFAEQQAAAASAQTNQKTFLQMQSDAAEAEKQMGIVQARIKAIDPTDNALRAIVTVTDPAHASAIATSPAIGSILAGSMAVGLIMGLLLAAAVDRRGTASHIAGMPILARLPAVQRRHLSPATADRVSPALALSAACKAIHRTLEAVVAWENHSGENHADVGVTVAITSSHPREGKSTLTSLLAATLAREGRKVVVVDANLHQPTLGRLFSVDSGDGLADYLQGDDESASMQFVQSCRDGMVDVVAAGNVQQTDARIVSQQLLDGERFTHLLADLAHAYDFVLVDSPADSVGSDAQIIAASVDRTIILANNAISGRASMRRLREKLSLVGGRVLGVVLNAGKEPIATGNAAPATTAPATTAPATTTTVQPAVVVEVVPVDVTRRAGPVAARAAVAAVDRFAADGLEDAFGAARHVEEEVEAAIDTDFAERFTAQFSQQWAEQLNHVEQRIRLPREEVILCVGSAMLAAWAMLRGSRILFDRSPAIIAQHRWSGHAIDAVLWLAALAILTFLGKNRWIQSQRGERSSVDTALALFSQVSLMAAALITLAGTSGGSPGTIIFAAALSSCVGVCLATLWIAPERAMSTGWAAPMVVAIIGYFGAAAGSRLPGASMLHGAVRALSSPSPMAYASLGTLGSVIGAWLGRAIIRRVGESQAGAIEAAA